MRAAVIAKSGLQYRADYPLPEIKPGWARIKVRLAGICRTDIELLRGYKAFEGVPGHEFVGVVDDCENASRIGKRVVGEINVACGHCDSCLRGIGRHCLNRLTLGLIRLDGCMAEYCMLPMENLFPVPPDMPDEHAVLTEPLSAACEILEQLPLAGHEKVIVLGDGRLGILCAWVLSTVVANVTLVGHHPDKLDRARWRDIKTVFETDGAGCLADVVIEATGSAQGLALAMSLCRPRGTIVLKSTIATPWEVNLSTLVVNEQDNAGVPLRQVRRRSCHDAEPSRYAPGQAHHGTLSPGPGCRRLHGGART